MEEREELLRQIARLERLKVVTRRLTIALVLGSVAFASFITSNSIKVLDTQGVFNARMPYNVPKQQEESMSTSDEGKLPE
jgi:hypothetical protein